MRRELTFEEEMYYHRLYREANIYTDEFIFDLNFKGHLYCFEIVGLSEYDVENFISAELTVNGMVIYCWDAVMGVPGDVDPIQLPKLMSIPNRKLGKMQIKYKFLEFIDKTNLSILLHSF